MPHVNLKSEAEWLAIRESNIGGSEIAGLFAVWQLPDGTERVLHAYEEIPEGSLPLGSCSPYTNAYKLFLNKGGLMMPEDFNPSERMQAGTYFEPAMAEWARAKWEGWPLRKVKRYSLHPEVQGWGASVDYEVHEPGMAPVEFKNIDGLIAKTQWQIEKGEVISAPLHIQLQLQHYIGARESKRGWIVACVGGNELVRGEFQAHEPTIARIREAIEAFWAGVARGDAPIEVADYETVAEHLAFGTGITTNLSGDAEAAALAKRYMRLKKHADFMEAILDRTKAKLAIKVGEGTKAIGDGFKVTWPVVNRPEKMVPAKIQSAMSYRGGFTVRSA